MSKDRLLMEDGKIVFLGLNLAAWVALIVAFSFDEEFPLIKAGHAGSYFGFSVAQHQQVINESTSVNWLLVGAPLDQNLQPGTNGSGAAWMCPVTTLNQDCIQIPLDGKSFGSTELSPPKDYEEKDGQWLGVSVSSQGPGGKASVCAHRYISDNIDMFGQGLCYTLTQALELHESWEPCKGKPTNSPHEEFGYCQVGVSGMMLGERLLMGAPGPYTWRGAIFAQDTLDDFFQRDKTTYHSPVLDDTSPIGKYSYLGMSVGGGDLLGLGEVFLAGAPRAYNDKGAVLFFHIDNIYMSPIMNHKLSIKGEQYFSSFGYEIATADINGDNIPDLIVGAPNYFEKDGEGAVYVYLNKKFGFSKKYDNKLLGPPDSWFGSAISKVGDLNRDGFEDVAIGAPYIDNGKVFIYLGTASGLSSKISQELVGSSYNGLGFGCSLSGGLDMDGNGFPDLLVGAYQSAQVFLFRAHPLIGLNITAGAYTDDAITEDALSNIDPNKTCNEHPCFKLELCVELEPHTWKEAWLEYTLVGDTDNMNAPRVWFNYLKNSRNVKKGLLRLPYESSANTPYCHSNTVFIRRNSRHIRTPINFIVEYKINYEMKEPQGLLPLNDYPFLDPRFSTKEFKATFIKECGDDNICKSNFLINYSINLPKDDDGETFSYTLGEISSVQLKVEVANKGENAYSSMLFVEHSPLISFIGKAADEKCEIKTATLVVCEIGDPIERQSIPRVNLRFDIHNITNTGVLVAFVMFANTTSILEEPVERPKTIKVRTLRKIIPPNLKCRTRPSEILLPRQVVKGISSLEDIGPPIKHVYTITNQDDRLLDGVELQIDWPYQRSTVKEYKTIFYIEKDPVIIGGEGECKMLFHGLVDPLRLASNDTGQDESVVNTTETIFNRRKRDLPKKMNTSNSILLDCESGLAQCIKFRCKINPIPPEKKVEISISARMWNATLVDLAKSNVSEIKIASRATVVIKFSNETYLDPSPDFQKSRMVEAVLKVHMEKEITTSRNYIMVVIVLSAFIGMLILSGIIWVLKKCNFFVRTSQEEEPSSPEESEKLKE